MSLAIAGMCRRTRPIRSRARIAQPIAIAPKQNAEHDPDRLDAAAERLHAEQERSDADHDGTDQQQRRRPRHLVSELRDRRDGTIGKTFVRVHGTPSVARQTADMEPFTVPDSVLGPRDVVVVEGPDALSYLQSQVSQDLRDMPVGGSAWTLVLEPTGKIASLARATRSAEERFELDTDAGFGADLLARLDRFKIRVKAVTTLVEADVEAPGATSRSGSSWVGRRWATRSCPARRCRRAPVSPAIAVNFTKGCYPGQELVERMDSRGAEAPRTLRRIDVPAGSAQGDPVRDGDQEVGEITSVVLTRALAWVKRSSGAGEVVLH